MTAKIKSSVPYYGSAAFLLDIKEFRMKLHM